MQLHKHTLRWITAILLIIVMFAAIPGVAFAYSPLLEEYKKDVTQDILVEEPEDMFIYDPYVYEETEYIYSIDDYQIYNYGEDYEIKLEYELPIIIEAVAEPAEITFAPLSLPLVPNMIVVTQGMATNSYGSTPITVSHANASTATNRTKNHVYMSFPAIPVDPNNSFVIRYALADGREVNLEIQVVNNVATVRYILPPPTATPNINPNFSVWLAPMERDFILIDEYINRSDRPNYTGIYAHRVVDVSSPTFEMSRGTGFSFRYFGDYIHIRFDEDNNLHFAVDHFSHGFIHDVVLEELDTANNIVRRSGLFINTGLTGPDGRVQVTPFANAPMPAGRNDGTYDRTNEPWDYIHRIAYPLGFA